MKIIIIEGQDNTGKDTLISSIKEYFNNLKIKEIHCLRPKHKHNIDAAIEQDNYYLELVDNIIENKYNSDIIILNRSWYSEYVYGSIYRERDRNYVKNIILRFEEKLQNFDVSYIQLLSNDVNLLIKNDDGKSLADNNENIMTIEHMYFKEIFDASTIKNKKLIIVNDENGNFKSKKYIANIALETIK